MSEPIWEITASVRQPVLEVSSRYGRIEVLHDVSVSVGKGRILSLIGANGAGKTTLLKTISGAQPTSSGSIVFDGKAVDRVRADLRVRLGLAQVPEGRQVSGALSVEDNLLLGGWTSSRENVSVDLDEAYSTFPILHEKRPPIGRLALRRPAANARDQLRAHEPTVRSSTRRTSMGLSPLLIDQVFEAITTLRTKGLTVLLVEQNASLALSIADDACVMETGRIVSQRNGK
jgi:branched-chain amino acid transport system ATP-binding protein